MYRYAIAVFLVVVTRAFAGWATNDSAEARVLYIPCDSEDDAAFTVSITYDIKNSLSRSETIYFKKIVAAPWTGYGGAGRSISCGVGVSIHARVSSYTQDDGIHVSTTIRRIGKNPDEYSSSIVLPWTATKIEFKDERARITALVKWKHG